jgi:ubiquinone biosynthesis protein UbiJ
MLQIALTLFLESSVNKILATDSATLNALEKLSGKVFEFKITDAPIHLFLLPHSAGIDLQQSYDHPADTCLTGSISEFRSLATASDKSSQLFGNGVSISGDVQLANKLQRITAGALIDWEGLIANYSSDLIAHQIFNFGKSAFEQSVLTKESLALNLGEYLQEEIQTLPPRAQVDGFVEDIDSLNQQVDRLDARIANIEHKILRATTS